MRINIFSYAKNIGLVICLFCKGLIFFSCGKLITIQDANKDIETETISSKLNQSRINFHWEPYPGYPDLYYLDLSLKNPNSHHKAPFVRLKHMNFQEKGDFQLNYLDHNYLKAKKEKIYSPSLNFLYQLSEKPIRFVVSQSTYFEWEVLCHQNQDVSATETSICENQQFSLPKVLFLIGEVQLKGNSYGKWDQILISKGSIIKTFQYNLTWETQLLKIDSEASLMTFDQTSLTSQGRSGGSLTIKADVGEGLLNLFARGENGNEGKSGAPYESTAKNGRSFIEKPEHRSIPPFVKWNQPQSARVIKANYQRAQFVKVCDGVHPDAFGTPGENGLPGRDGSQGGNGGHTPFVWIKIKNSEHFKLNFYEEVGQGGPGGEGGPGQKGGQGGVSALTRCGRIAAPNGLNGPSGKRGLDGEPGKTVGYCIILSHLIQGLCVTQ